MKGTFQGLRLFPCQPSMVGQGQGTAASPGLDIVTNLALEVPSAWFLQGKVSYSGPDHIGAICSFICRPEVIFVLNVDT